jgi:malonyl-CoA O-methyltransferase
MFDTRAIGGDFGRAAPHYDAHAHMQAQVRRHAYGLAQKLWPPGSHILDAGCGTGAFARDNHQWRVTGMDLAYGMCAAAGGVNAQAETMPFADGCFDGAFSSLMLQWANDPATVLRQMQRVVKPGGSCVVSTLCDGTLHELQTAFAHIDSKPHTSRFATVQAWRGYAAQAGLHVTACEPAGIVEHYPDALALMRALRNIGASNKLAERQRGLMTPGQLARLQSAYAEQFGTAKGLPATWQILYMTVSA